MDLAWWVTSYLENHPSLGSSHFHGHSEVEESQGFWGLTITIVTWELLSNWDDPPSWVVIFICSERC